jgi:hypothetical protein
LDVHPREAAFFRHHEGITHFFHTFMSVMQQRQCRGSSFSPQHLSSSGKLISQYLIGTSQILNLPCGFAQCTKVACGTCATYLLWEVAEKEVYDQTWSNLTASQVFIHHSCDGILPSRSHKFRGDSPEPKRKCPVP